MVSVYNGLPQINFIFLIMKKAILNLGKALNITEQKQITGGNLSSPDECDENPGSLECICKEKRKPRLMLCD